MQIIEPIAIVKDSRRTLTHLLRANIQDINFCEAKRGAKLGNHKHLKTTEYFYITKGTCMVTIGSDEKIVNKGTLFAVPLNIKHTVECLTDVNYLTFLTEKFDYDNPDIH